MNTITEMWLSLKEKLLTLQSQKKTNKITPYERKNQAKKWTRVKENKNTFRDSAVLTVTFVKPGDAERTGTSNN